MSPKSLADATGVTDLPRNVSSSVQVAFETFDECLRGGASFQQF